MYVYGMKERKGTDLPRSIVGIWKHKLATGYQFSINSLKNAYVNFQGIYFICFICSVAINLQVDLDEDLDAFSQNID